MIGGELERLLRRLIREEVVAALRESSSASQPTGLVTVAEYAAARSISVSYVRAAIRDGRLASTKIGRAVRVQANAEIANKATVATDHVTAIADRRLGIVRGRAGGV